jgi:two-component system, NtrC family, sensor histidine kinase PilS
MNASKSSTSTETVLFGRIHGLIFGRMAMLFVLLLASWWWTSSYLEVSIDSFPRGLFLFFAASMFLTAAYFLLSRLDLDHEKQLRWQLIIDAVLITWLVRETGDVFSPYVTLYVLLIFVSSFFLSKLHTILLAGWCALCFTLLSILTTQSVIYSQTVQEAPSRIIQTIAFNNVAILLVGLLAARVAERRRLSEELKHTEESFADLHLLHERIVESIGSGLVTSDLDGRIYAFNRTAEEITGIRSSEAFGHNIYELFGDVVRTHLDRKTTPPNSESPDPEVFEVKFGQITAACAASPLIGRKGEVNGTIVTFQDITKVRQLEETVRRSDRMAAVGRMAAGLAHELRNPLGSMNSALQFIQERGANNGTERLMDVVLRESERLNHIITNFLSYARPSEKIDASGRYEPADLCATIRDGIALIRHNPDVVENHKIDLILPENQVVVAATEAEIKQIVWNLALNSIQAMPGGGKLSISVYTPNEWFARIEFADDGPGIDPEIMDHLFEPFVSGSGGTGLGLSIVHKIITENGGRININTREGKGTTVSIELKRVKKALTD